MKKSEYAKMMDNYPILYCMRNKSYMETCMYWGIEAGTGWYSPLKELSEMLESLNKYYYLKYNIRIQADQVKEKYGTLHFYYSVVIDPPKYKRFLALPFSITEDLINKFVHFKFETKRIQMPSVHTEWEEINKEKFDLQQVANIKNYEHSEFKEENGKYYRSYEIYDPGKFETILKNHKLLWKIKNLCSKVKYKFYKFIPTEKQHYIQSVLDSLTQKLIDECEDKCYNICEICGCNKDIITTRGWISRICKNCAEKGNKKYE